MLKKLFEFTPAIALTALLVGLGSFVLWSSNYLDSKGDMLGAVLTSNMTGSTSLAVLNAKFDSIDALTDTIPGDTDDLSEGTTNLYYTLDRVNGRIYAVVGATTSLPNLNITESQISDLGDYIELTDLSSTATGLTYTNTTGVFSLSAGYAIPQSTSITNWDTAYGWGNHSSAGYLTGLAQLGQIGDVSTSSLADGYVLKYSGTGWESVATSTLGISGGGSGEGTVNAGTAGQIAYYLADGTAVSGTSTLFVSTSKNVGIGTSTPAYKLDVYGNTRIDGAMRVDGPADFYDGEVTINDGYALQIYNDGNTDVGLIQFGYGELYLQSDTDLSFYADEDVLIKPTGNIGIGTSTPAYKLDVYGNTRIDGAMRVDGPADFYDGEVTINNGYSMIFFDNTNTEDAILQYAYGEFYINSGENIGLYADSDVIIKPAGNTGIGTSTPAYKLDVYGNTRIDGDATIRGDLITTSLYSSANMQLEADSDLSFYANDEMLINGENSVTIQTSAGELTDKIIIAGNCIPGYCPVGIGTSTPDTSYKLDVYGNARIDGNITANNLNISAWDAKWTFASTTLDYWFDNTTGLTRLNSYLSQAYASSTFYTKLEIDAFGYMTQAYASSTFLTITDAQSSYDVKGQATSTLSSHTSTYNHANYDTAYGWGNHASGGYLGQSSYYATTTHATIADLPALNTYPAFSIASSTWMSIAGRTASSTVQLKPAYTAETWAGIRCATDAGTALIKIGDGTNWMTAFTASTTAGLIAVSSNNTFTAGEVIKAVVSNIDATVNWISCSVSKKNQ